MFFGFLIFGVFGFGFDVVYDLLLDLVCLVVYFGFCVCLCGVFCDMCWFGFSVFWVWVIWIFPVFLLVWVFLVFWVLRVCGSVVVFVWVCDLCLRVASLSLCWLIWF